MRIRRIRQIELQMKKDSPFKPHENVRREDEGKVVHLQSADEVLVALSEEMAEELYIKLGFRYIDDKDFFGHKMKHMIKQLNMTGQYYRHFKGNIYKVLHIAKHSETLEYMVVYQAMNGDYGIWVRPAAMFEEVIEREGKTFRRFEPISEDEAKSIIDNA